MPSYKRNNRVPYIKNFILHFSLALRFLSWLRSIGIEREHCYAQHGIRSIYPAAWSIYKNIKFTMEIYYTPPESPRSGGMLPETPISPIFKGFRTGISG